MDNQQGWLDLFKKVPAWVSGLISLVTAIIGFVLLLQGNYHLGVTILTAVVAAALLMGGVYLAFAKTPPLVAGGRGVYRFENYRPWALIGIGFVLGFVCALLLPQQNRLFVMTALLGQEPAPAAAGATTTSPGAGGSGQATLSAVPVEACLQSYMEEAADQLMVVAVGARNVPLAGSGQGPVAMLITEFEQVVGYVQFELGPGQTWRVQEALDPQCREMDQYSNITTGQFQGGLQATDQLRIQLGQKEYYLFMEFEDTGGVKLDYLDINER